MKTSLRLFILFLLLLNYFSSKLKQNQLDPNSKTSLIINEIKENSKQFPSKFYLLVLGGKSN